MYVYKITNLVNGKIYIGQHSGRDLQVYLNHNIRHALDLNYKNKTRLYNALRKYVPTHGDNCFKIEALNQLSANLSKSQARELLDKLEIFYIKYFNSQNDSIGYNITAGGGGQLGTSRPHTPESKRKLSLAAKGREITWKAKISAALKGKKFSEERKRNLSASQKGIPKKPRTVEHCQKISENKKRWWAEMSAERKEKMSLAIREGRTKYGTY